MSANNLNQIAIAKGENHDANDVSAEKNKLRPYILIEPANAHCSNESTSILQVDKDSLAYICQFLSFRDQISFCLTCQHFQNAFLLDARVRCKTFDINKWKQFSLDETENMLKIIGPFVQIIKGSRDRRENMPHCHLVLRYATQVNKVQLEHYNFSNSVCETLFHHSITDLSLIDCEINDAVISALKQLPQLTTLSLERSYNVRGNHLCELTTLTHLTLAYCYKITNENWIQIFKSLKNLTSLNIIGNTNISGDALQLMAQHCQQLQTLKIELRKGYEGYVKYIAKLPNLVHLDCICCRNDTLIQLVEALVQHKSKQLKVFKISNDNVSHIDFEMFAHYLGQLVELVELHIIFPYMKRTTFTIVWSNICNLKNLQVVRFSSYENLNYLTNSHIFELIKECSQLKLIRIGGGRNITAELLYDVIAYRNKVNGIPIVFELIDSYIDKGILKDPIYVASKVKAYFQHC